MAPRVIVVRLTARPHTLCLQRLSTSCHMASAAGLLCQPTTTPFALRISQRGAKSRSLNPDDPFGERSSWEDPSDGLYSAWKDVDLDGFAAAANSAEVRQAHFGPEWARFATVGRLSIKKMNEGHHTARGEDAEVTSAGSNGSPSSSSSPQPQQSSTQPQSALRSAAELANEQELRQKKKLMERNFTSYEAYLAAEYGDNPMSASTNPTTQSASACGRNAEDDNEDTREPFASLYASAALEKTFFDSVDGRDAHDRMTLRNPHRDALLEAEATEVDESLPLPEFMMSPAEAGSVDAAATAGGAPSAPSDKSAQVSQASRGSLSSPADDTARLSYTQGAAPTNTTTTTTVTTTDVPENFVREALTALGARHGNLAIPLVDPIEWDTDTVLLFLRQFEQCASAEATVMDDTMCDAFAMAQVDGRVLLDVVVPPRLFRVLRRWHTRRRDAVVRAHRLMQDMAVSGQTGAAETHEMFAKVANESVPKLDEAVAPITPLLIQETILLCFPYGGGGRG